MGYVVLVTLKESISEPEVDEVLAQMLGISSVVSVTPEWRSDRKKKRLVMSERQTSRDTSSPNQNSKNFPCSPCCHDENDDFDTKLMSLFGNSPSECTDVKNDSMDTDTDYENEDKIDVICKKHSPPPTNGPGRPKKKRAISPSPNKEMNGLEDVIIKDKKSKSSKEKESETAPDEDNSPKTANSSRTPVARVECQICKKDVQMLQLRWHAATHCERKQYKCASCDFSGNIPQVMRNHVTQKHDGTDPTRGKDYLDDFDDNLKNEWIRISAECFPAYADVTRSHIEKNRRRIEG